jgi:hypothetical protein
VNLNISADVRKIERTLSDLQKKQIPYAASVAINNTAKAVQQAEIKAMDEQLDRPTPFTKRGIGITRSSKTKLIAEVFIKDIQASYLRYQIKGGERLPKKKAIALPAGIKTNQYGNIPRGRIKKLLANKKKYFSGIPNGRTKGAGIWERVGVRKQIRMVVAYEPKVRYRPRYDFRGVAMAKALKEFPLQMRIAITKAIRSAKK